MPTQKEIDKVAAETMEAAKKEMRRYDKVSSKAETPKKADKRKAVASRSAKRKSVVHGSARSKSRASIFNKIRDGILPEGCNNFGDYIVDYIMVPYIQGAIQNAIGGFLPGWNKNTGRGSVYKDYTSAYRGSSYGSGRRTNKTYTNYSKVDYRTVQYDNPQDARQVLDDLRDTAKMDQYASVLDFLEFSDQPSTSTDDDWGWSYNDLMSARVRPIGNGWWKIDLPRPVQID